MTPVQRLGVGVFVGAVAVALAIAVVRIATADEDYRPVVAVVPAGPDDTSSHLANHHWASAANVYLARPQDGWAFAWKPDGPVLAVSGCTLEQSTYDVIRRLHPQGIIALGTVCAGALNEAQMTPGERAALPRFHPEYDPGRRAMWQTVAQCESSGNWGETAGSFEGGIQFTNQTWLAYGGGGFAQHAYHAAPEHQIVVGERVLWRGYGAYGPQGRGAWPHCSAGLRAP